MKNEVMEVDEEELTPTETALPSSSDLCQTLMERYAKSSAPQHRHLCASAAAMKAILAEESLPFTPPGYFAATISAINDASESLDSEAIAALSSFLSIVLPLVPSESLPPSKAMDAVSVLVALLVRSSESVSAAAVRSIIKSVENLIQFCNLEDWEAVKLLFETVFRFSIDKRPKVRRCAQVCVKKVFESFHSSICIKEASKVVLTLFKSYMPQEFGVAVARVADGSKDKSFLKPADMEFVHMLNSLKIVVPYLSKNVRLKVLSSLYKLVTCKFSPLTRHVFDVLGVFFESSRAELIVPEVEDIILSLVSYVSAGQKNPMDTVISASTLLKSVLFKLHTGDPSIYMRNFPMVLRSIAGLLVVGPNASHAAGILKELICKHMNSNTIMANENQVDNNAAGLRALESTCAVFENVISSDNGVPNEHTLAVISDFFLKLGDVSHRFMKNILLKLADILMLENEDTTLRKQLEECIGSAVIAMGPEKILALIPVSLHEEKLTCSNLWLVPILKKNVVGASLQYYMDHILPLAETLRGACRKVKKTSLRRDVKKCIRALWDLLPVFCRYPTDTYKSFKRLAKCLVVYLKEDNYLHENIALALQELVNQNRDILESTWTASVSVKRSAGDLVEESIKASRSVPSQYSRKLAMKNIKALKSCSVELLPALIDLFFNSPPEKRTYLKEAIGCLASISESSDIKRFFVMSLEKFMFINELGESEKLETSVDKDVDGNSKNGQKHDESRRCMILELASSLVKGADEDLIITIFDYVRSALQVIVAVGQSEAYYTLSRIFQDHSWFCASRLNDIMDLLLGLKSPADVMSLRSRFACFHMLLVFILKSDLEERNEKAFLILNEIILALKDPNEESRKATYEVLLEISGSLMDSPSAASGSSHQQLCNMIMGYLSGAPPPIMSGAVAALSLLIYKNSDFCVSVPELVPTVLALLKSKANEVIKAVLGFVKVLVSGLQTSHLQNLLSDILSGILPWSSISRNHFRSKVTIILEIIIRKCGSASVESHVPEKYRGFMKNVMEQRRGKTQSKDADHSDTVPKQPVQSSEGNRKRTGGVTDSGTSSTMRKEFSKKRKFGTFNSNDRHKSTHNGNGKPNHLQSNPSGGESKFSTKHAKRRRDFGKTTHIAGKRKTGHGQVSNKTKTPNHIPASVSELRKHETVKRPRRTNK